MWQMAMGRPPFVEIRDHEYVNRIGSARSQGGGGRREEGGRRAEIRRRSEGNMHLMADGC